MMLRRLVAIDVVSMFAVGLVWGLGRYTQRRAAAEIADESTDGLFEEPTPGALTQTAPHCYEVTGAV